MIKELINFTNSLNSEVKSLGMKPKDGIHVLVKILKEEDTLYIDKDSIIRVCYTKNATEEDFSFLKKCAQLAEVAWSINTNKCFDLPAKGIHSVSPYCVALKKESLEGGEKYNKDSKKIYDRIDGYFANALQLVESESEKERIKLFRNFLNFKEKINFAISFFQEQYNQLKDKEYLIFYLDEPVEKYQESNVKYLSDKLFNTAEYNVNVEDITFGTSDFFNGFPTKKPFLMHQSATFDITSRISAPDAKSLFEIHGLLNRGIFPRPLPIFIYDNERIESVRIISKGVEKGEKIGYQEIIKEIRTTPNIEIGNYYLLYYWGGVIKDFDYVSKFQYFLGETNESPWIISDLFDINYYEELYNVFELELKLLIPIFNNALITRTKTGDYQRKWFDEIETKYCKTDNTFLLIMKYRKAFYDYIYKSQRQSVTQKMFDDILLTGIIDDIKLDELSNGLHSQRRNILQKMNIWFSLSEKFNINNKNRETMASKLQQHREFMSLLTKQEVSIENDEQYAFAVGQVIYYLFTKSKTSDRSYKRLEPFMQQARSAELNKAIVRLFDSYKHENFSTNFKSPFAEVLAYTADVTIRELMPVVLSGFFSKNELFSIKETAENEEKPTED